MVRQYELLPKLALSLWGYVGSSEGGRDGWVGTLPQASKPEAEHQFDKKHHKTQLARWVGSKSEEKHHDMSSNRNLQEGCHLRA